MGDVVLETGKAETRKYRAEENHRYYIRSQSENWREISIYTVADECGCSGEEVVANETQDVEQEVIERIRAETVRKALSQLDAASYQLIHSLYLAPQQKTEREIAQDLGLSQNAVNKRKKKILKTLKFLVVKIQKSQQ
jgi:RNA polymerase sigma factor (sigma-70 family)